ncbi:MAG: PAS domain S-box protein, partial [Gallionellaceae bacterium]|nr:PAS domain S-box protein [Gallionellaceae bacterium]
MVPSDDMAKVLIRQMFSIVPAAVFLAALTLCLPALASEARQDVHPAATVSPAAPLATLTAPERAWLREHPVIRVVQDPGWPPVEFVDARGEPSGMTADYLRLIEQRLGVKFERLRNLSWQEAYARLKHHEIDMTTSVVTTPERTEFWAFTQPYMRIPIVIVTNSEVTYIADLRELAGKRVAVVAGYAVADWLPRDFPEIRLVRVKTVREGLEQLQRGEVFAFVESMLVVDYYLAKLNLTTLKIAGQTPYINAQAMAVRKDWAPLAGILDQALDSISAAERDTIYRKWLPVRYEDGFDYPQFMRLLALFAVVLLGLAWWIRRLTSEVQRRKAAETALRDSEERFRRALENIPDVVTIYDRDLIIRYINEATRRLTGRPTADFIGRREEEVWPPEVYEAYLPTLREAFRTRSPQSLETRIVLADGVTRILQITCVPLVDEQGEVREVLGITHDHTESRLAEAALESEALRRRLLMESSQDGIAIINQQHQVVEANPRFAEMLGYTPEEVLDLHTWDWEANLTEAEVRVNFAQLSMASATFETRHRRKDGTAYEVEVSIGGAMVGDEPMVFTVSRDISARKQAEAQLRKLAQAVEQSPESIVIANLEAEIEYVNEAFVQNTGYSREEAIGQNPRILHSEKTPKDTYGALWESLTQGRPWQGEFINKRKDGSEYVEFAIITPLRQPDGTISHYVAVKADITEKKRLADELDRHRHHLERLVEARTLELAEARDRAEAATRAKSAFLANMSHEIRTPMNAILGMTHLLMRGDLDPRQMEQMDKIGSAGRHLLGLINDILDISKIEAGRLVLEQTDFAIAAIPRNVASM